MTALQRRTFGFTDIQVHDVYLGLGSNLRRQWHLSQACIALRTSLGPLRCSSVFESRAVGLSAPPFFNMVVQAQTSRSLASLVAELKALEVRFGRCRETPEQVSLDIDLLMYGDQVGQFGDLELPRPEILEQAFVLKPLAQLAPTSRHPRNGQTFSELWNGFAVNAPLTAVELSLPSLG
ncbi:2-amino-4-hydroxy-6-hydroxymethyldihydropteridine pyrophosphokinase [Pseudomonas laurentiana]|uniref:2-amino-4-hydroxy-6- hydroxymethyldihydropteridine diphosphokinase n=1 Tax=Pseudomonas laurentiana TaxID=2364649 RepID=UPI001674B8E4|nr:2-amino-4-hydroxy-6-hydroxymethyldihydropteridine diphosphokinase [Pseudomonas laurentiana]GGU53484.1 2-amino-4-hydroxy-6-hydroxymethyldihydropteridine pyrophosphokinase [Pseudomonas laurentiana]